MGVYREAPTSSNYAVPGVNILGSARKAAETWAAQREAVLAWSRLWDPVGGPHRHSRRKWL